MTARRFRPGEEAELWQIYHDTTHAINGEYYTRGCKLLGGLPTTRIRRNGQRVRSRDPLVAEEDGYLLGFAELEIGGHIDYFYCHRRWQRKCVGTELCRALEGEARCLGMPALHAEVNVPAKPFSLSMGFDIMGDKAIWFAARQQRDSR